MRSVLTPLVFRRILRNEPIIHRDCLYRRGFPLRNHHVRPLIYQQRRSLFGWISPVPREAMVATGERASLVYLKDACARLDNRVRPPPTNELAKAWTNFVRERFIRQGKLSDVEAVYVTRIFELLKKTEAEQFQESISAESILDAMNCINTNQEPLVRSDAAEAFCTLSRALFEEIDMRTRGESASAESKEKLGTGSDFYSTIWRKYLATLVHYGQTEEARNAIATAQLDSATIESAWKEFLSRVATSDLPLKDAESLPGLIEKQICPLTPALKMGLANVFANNGNMASAKEFAILKRDGGRLVDDSEYLSALLTACRKHDDRKWGQDIIKTITADAEAMNNSETLWNAMLTWALATGKSVDEISRMIEVMASTMLNFTPSSLDINSLIRVANEKRDPYLSERLMSLGEEWGRKPDEETYLLQMDYRLSVDDVEGARTSFAFVRSFQEVREDGSPRINKLIQAMCMREKYSYDDIMAVVDVLGERQGRFEASTVAALSRVHLNKDEYTDVADLLLSNVKDFSLSDRALVREGVLAVALDANTPLRRLWDTYMIFQHVFEEAPRKDRLSIMQRFFDLKRPDMAVHVFNHMRRHASPAINPDTETYVTALLGCGATQDVASLAVVNNVLKLDIVIDETTRLHNARMLAFFRTGDPFKAQAVWEDIIRSDEGPSRNSLLLVFRVSEEADFGEIRARSVWEMVRRMDVPLDAEIVAAYVGALAGNGCDDDAKMWVERCEKELGVQVDDIILAKLFNGITSSVRQLEVESWIKEHYPERWTQLQKKGFKLRYNDTRELPLDVTLAP